MQTSRKANTEITTSQQDGATASGADEPAQNIATYTLGWLSSIRSRVHIVCELAIAEARLAATSVAVMLFLAVSAAVLLLGAWGLLLAGLVNGLLQFAIPLWAILVGLALLHILAALFLVWRALGLTENLHFSATRGHFQQRREPG